MKIFYRVAYITLTSLLLASCGNSDMIQPSQKIGPMWVNRYGHTNAAFIWNYCDDSLTDAPGIKTTECTIPQVDELFIGYGIRGVDKIQRDALWDARMWELSIDGHAVDLPAFNIADFNNTEQDGITYEYRLWRIRLREIPEGEHTLHYVMHVNQLLENDPSIKSHGTYELIVNFTYIK